MVYKKYKIQKYKEYTFFFKYEPDIEGLLHIWVRHLTTPKDSIKTFLEGDTIWNEEHKRFETKSEAHTIYWLWLNEKEKKIMIITCFSI